MTREEAIENLKGLLESNYVDSFEDEENESLRMAIQALEQKSNLEKICEELAAENDDLRDQLAMRDRFKIEPCDDVARERYKDLCEYFGDTKDILKSRKDFKAWLERIKWHVRKAEELYEKYEHKQEPCDDVVSRQAVLDGIEELKQSPWFNDDTHEAKIIRKEAVETVEDLCVKQLPPVRPQEPISEQWQELKETIIELRDNDGTGTQQEVCKFLANYMEVLEKQMQEPKTETWSIKDVADTFKKHGLIREQEPKTGHWIEHPEIETSTPEYLMFYECSECEDKQCFYKTDIHKKRFCTNCGARMESEDKE